MARCCAYIFSDAGVCRTPREKPHDRTPTNRLTDARTKSRSLASAAAPASASMAARCAIQILWTNPGLAISGRRGNGSAGVSIHVQHPTNSEVKVSISGCAMRILEENGSEAVFPEMCVLNGVGPNWNGVIFGGSILWSQSVPRAFAPASQFQRRRRRPTRQGRPTNDNVKVLPGKPQQIQHGSDQPPPRQTPPITPPGPLILPTVANSRSRTDFRK